MSPSEKVWKVIKKNESRIRALKGIELGILWDLYVIEFPKNADESEFTRGIEMLKKDEKIIQSGEGKSSMISLP